MVPAPGTGGRNGRARNATPAPQNLNQQQIAVAQPQPSAPSCGRPSLPVDEDVIERNRQQQRRQGDEHDRRMSGRPPMQMDTARDTATVAACPTPARRGTAAFVCHIRRRAGQQQYRAGAAHQPAGDAAQHKPSPALAHQRADFPVAAGTERLRHQRRQRHQHTGEAEENGQPDARTERYRRQIGCRQPPGHQRIDKSDAGLRQLRDVIGPARRRMASVSVAAWDWNGLA